MSHWLDEALQGELGPEAARALWAWCDQTGSSYSLVSRLAGGRSGALVAAVLEQDPVEGDRQLVLKLDGAPGGPGDPGPSEFARQRAAVAAAPEFAGRHLARPVRQPVAGGDGRWFAFQQVAADSLRDYITLRSLLDAVLHPTRPPRGARDGWSAGPGVAPGFPPGQASAAAFAQAGGAVVRSVLADWAGRPRLARLDVPAILGRQLGRRLAPGGALRRLAAEHTGPTIDVEGEDGPLPNPFSLALGEVAATVTLPAFVGHAHGDLHVENILIPRTLRDVGGAYQLIDLSRYAGDAVLTRDPTHLVLHVLARTLVDLSPAQRTATIDLLLQADAYDDALVPRWLSLFIGEVRAAGEGWARQASLVDQWRDQMPLSVLACALTCLIRPSTREEDRGWFLRLAANATAVFLAQHDPGPARLPTPAGAPAASPAAAAPAARGAAPSASAEVPAARAARSAPSPDADAEVDAEVDVDVVISHVAADLTWAEWISWHLEEGGWGIDLSDADAVEPRRGASRGALTLLVLSPACLAALTTGPGTGSDGPGPGPMAGPARGDGTSPSAAPPLVIIRVEPCEPPDWLGATEMVDVVGLGEADARDTLAAWSRRALPPPRRPDSDT